MAGWAGLGRFWLTITVVMAVAAGVLQVLPVRIGSLPRTAEHALPVSLDKTTSLALPDSVKRAQSPSVDVARPGRLIPGPVAGPDPALLEPNQAAMHAALPRIAPDGRTPMYQYAAGFNTAIRRPRVGILVAGIGMNEADSDAAVHLMPAGVTLAVSPYAVDTDRLLASVRAAEHEYLLSVPMEPQGFPENDPDDRHALMTSLPPSENMTRLHWAMTRFAGYVGVTNALGQLRGERLSGVAEQFGPLLEDVAARGLLFVDARIGQPVSQFAWNRSVDLVIDGDPVNEALLDERLEALAKMAKDRGSALGLVSIPRPVTLERVAAWINTLGDRGLVLAPVSALVIAPSLQEQGK
jgi:polysaccharide deacetylase 2 family uncharacterized protein YibQ